MHFRKTTVFQYRNRFLRGTLMHTVELTGAGRETRVGAMTLLLNVIAVWLLLNAVYFWWVSLTTMPASLAVRGGAAPLGFRLAYVHFHEADFERGFAEAAAKSAQAAAAPA